MREGRERRRGGGGGGGAGRVAEERVGEGWKAGVLERVGGGGKRGVFERGLEREGKGGV